MPVHAEKRSSVLSVLRVWAYAPAVHHLGGVRKLATTYSWHHDPSHT